MASTKPQSGKKSNKLSATKKPSAKNAPRQKPSQRSRSAKGVTLRQVKTKPAAFRSNKSTSKQQKVYTDNELEIPALNMTKPAGSQKPKGKKKGKMFIDDQESMMTILAIVNAEKEGQIESKIVKARQMEEIRQARHKEAEARQELRKTKLEETKNTLRRKHPREPQSDSQGQQNQSPPVRTKRVKKQVSFS